MLRIAVCDDDEIMTSRIERMLQEELHRLYYECAVDVFFSGEAFLKYVEDENPYDLLYLDIEMQQINGIEVARELRRKAQETLIIYISSHERYLIELFEVEPFRFIKKPVEEAVFQKVLQDACEKLREGNSFFHYSFNKIYSKVRLGDILYFESRGRLLLIHLSYGIERFYGKLAEVEDTLCSGKTRFVRIHQSYLINMDHVRRMGYDMVLMRNGDKLQISDKRCREIREKYLKGWK